jgi:chorismate synthase
MASNTCGTIFCITTWGESHGKAIGVVIDGCPAGLALDEESINVELRRRAPSGDNPYTTPRKEMDQANIYSGIFEGKTTGVPISIIIMNKDQDSSKYEPIKHLLRPGHANYTYIEKYGCFDYRGGGRASARETACRVAAGAVAKKLLAHYNVEIIAYIQSIGPVSMLEATTNLTVLKEQRDLSPVYCPAKKDAAKMMGTLLQAKKEGDSLGGTVAFTVSGLPVGLGDPVYEKLEANLAKAMMSIPASKAFSIGEGFHASSMRGSEHNDAFHTQDNTTKLASNNAGGTLGGISTGDVLYGQVAFKPTSSIQKKQKSVNLHGENETFQLPKGSRHDPCVAIRAVPVVEAMLALTLADAMLMNRCVRL